MAQEYQVTKAFQATVSKEDKTPKSFTNKAGQTLFVWKVQVAGNSNWININKQEGNVINPGDSIYGDIVPNQWNTGFDFRGEQRPLGQAPASSGSAPLTPAPAGSSSLEAKVDRILEVVEKLNGERDEALTVFGDTATSVDDLDI